MTSLNFHVFAAHHNSGGLRGRRLEDEVSDRHCWEHPSRVRLDLCASPSRNLKIMRRFFRFRCTQRPSWTGDEEQGR